MCLYQCVLILLRSVHVARRCWPLAPLCACSRCSHSARLRTFTWTCVILYLFALGYAAMSHSPIMPFALFRGMILSLRFASLCVRDFKIGENSFIFRQHGHLCHCCYCWCHRCYCHIVAIVVSKLLYRIAMCLCNFVYLFVLLCLLSTFSVHFHFVSFVLPQFVFAPKYVLILCESPLYPLYRSSDQPPWNHQPSIPCLPTLGHSPSVWGHTTILQHFFNGTLLFVWERKQI